MNENVIKKDGTGVEGGTGMKVVGDADRCGDR